uniref:Suppressor of forked domain-containing protein n=1 Tax=Panagrolaimus sp. JU765 TaxID=591449 RepID=A0AC34QR64_9BILA
MGRDRSRSRSRSPRRRSRSRGSRSPDPRMEEYNDLWKVLRDDPYNFDSWTKLIGVTEELDDIKLARDVYEPFLRKFPYCYGYWRKFADFELRHHSVDRSLEVYERAVTETPLSVDLWLSYFDFLKDIASNANKKMNLVKKLRHSCLRAAQGCGKDFRSDAIWTRFVDFEIEHHEYQRAMSLFDLIFTTMTLGYASHWDKFVEFIQNREPDEILTPEEYEDITKELLSDRLKNHEGPLYVTEEYEKQVLDEEGNIKTVTMKRKKHTEVALQLYRETIIERRRKTFQNNEREVKKRWTFESAIKRPYFHVKPLDREQLRNWHNYIDFEIAQPETKQSKKRIETLFERCLVACAIYEEMWIKYATYLDSIGETVTARKMYRKATEIHCPKKPALFLAYSAFEEKHGENDLADKILSEFQRRCPGYVSIELRRINIARRRIQKAKADKGDYGEVISKYEKFMKDVDCPNRLYSFYAIKLARMHLKVRHDRKLADKILKEAISRDKSNVKLYLALIDVHNSSSHFKEADVIEAFDFAIKAKDLTLEERYNFSLKKMDFLEELGSDVGKLNEAFTVHLALECQLPIPPPSIHQGKRLYSGKDEETDRKRAKLDYSGASTDRSSTFPSTVAPQPMPMNGMPYPGAPMFPPPNYGGYPGSYPPNMMFRQPPPQLSAEQLKPMLGLPNAGNGTMH